MANIPKNIVIDYVKIQIEKPDLSHLYKNKELDFIIEVSENTGELSTKKTATYHFCKIIIHESGNAFFQGSIHKMWNSIGKIYSPNYELTKNQYKGYNGNLFTLNNIIEVRSHLEKLFNCKPEQLIFRNIEFGVNTTPSFDPNLYIKGLLYHKGKMFEYRYNGYYAQVFHQRYIIKIYNKSIQYGINAYTQRVEVKILKMKELQSYNINSFNDITRTTLLKAQELILKRFDEVMHYDYTIDKKKLSKPQKRLVSNYSNPRYWINELKPNQRNRHSLKLSLITQNFSHNIHEKIRDEIIEKCSIINRLSKKTKCSIINRSNIGVKTLHNTPRKKAKKNVRKHIQNESYLIVNNRRWKKKEKGTQHLKKGWVGRKERVKQLGYENFTPQERKSFSIAKAKKSGNFALMYVRELGIPSCRSDGLHKALRKLVVQNYKNEINYHSQLRNVIQQIMNKGFIPDIESFIRAVNETRRQYKLETYLVEEKTIDELTLKQIAI